ncbi:MAG: alpha/beta fold hydrolase [Myxococcota bacterium]|nr:alpha/beta fold hydrolase [Myxococcota bacterium]
MRKLRLVFPGFPCAPEPWLEFLPSDRRNEVVPFSRVLLDTSRLTVSAMASMVATEIVTRKPATVVCHDFGGIFTLLAMAKLAAKDALPPCKVVVFNTAVYDFNVFVNRHPFKMQAATWERIERVAREIGTVADPAYATAMPRVRALYRRVILASLVGMALPGARRRIDLGVPSLFLRSNDDPFIAPRTLDALAEDVRFSRVAAMDYGHFPHSHPNAHALRSELVSFESD